MKFTESKKNFKEIFKDAKAIVSGSIGLVVDTIKIPYAFCKDVRDSYLEHKNNKEVVNAVVTANKKVC